MQPHFKVLSNSNSFMEGVINDDILHSFPQSDQRIKVYVYISINAGHILALS